MLVTNFEKKRDSQIPANAEILVRVQPYLEPTHSMGPVVNEELGQSKMQDLQRVNHGLYKLMVKKILNKKWRHTKLNYISSIRFHCQTFLVVSMIKCPN